MTNVDQNLLRRRLNTWVVDNRNKWASQLIGLALAFLIYEAIERFVPPSHLQGVKHFLLYGMFGLLLLLVAASWIYHFWHMGHIKPEAKAPTAPASGPKA